MTEGMHACLMAIADVVEGRTAPAAAPINGTAVRALIRQGLVCETGGAPWIQRDKRRYGPYGLTPAGQAEVRERRRYESIPDNERPRCFEERVKRHLRDAKRCAYCDADPVRWMFVGATTFTLNWRGAENLSTTRAVTVFCEKCGGFAFFAAGNFDFTPDAPLGLPGRSRRPRR
jgi:hypothetical protein